MSGEQSSWWTFRDLIRFFYYYQYNLDYTFYVNNKQQR